MQPLDYVIWVIPITNKSPQTSFLYDPIEMGPFHGKAFTVDM